jgi:hypothetical protein
MQASKQEQNKGQKQCSIVQFTMMMMITAAAAAALNCVHKCFAEGVGNFSKNATVSEFGCRGLRFLRYCVRVLAYENST